MTPSHSFDCGTVAVWLWFRVVVLVHEHFRIIICHVPFTAQMFTNWYRLVASPQFVWLKKDHESNSRSNHMSVPHSMFSFKLYWYVCPSVWCIFFVALTPLTANTTWPLNIRGFIVATFTRIVTQLYTFFLFATFCSYCPYIKQWGVFVTKKVDIFNTSI